MPSVSKSQQRLMGMAYAVKSGDMEISDIDPAYRDKVKSLSDGMTKKDLKKYASTKHDDLPETVDENFETANARISPDVSIGGMGEVSLPNAENGNIGSGDVPAVADIDDDEEEAKKDKTKKKLEMEGFKLFTQFNNFVTEGKSNFKVLLKTAREESVGIKIRLGDRKDPSHETWEKISKDTWMNLKTKEELDFNGWAKHADKFNMEGKDLQFENLAGSDNIYEAAVLENAVRDLHFEIDADKAEDMKIAIGTSQGEVTRRKQIEGGNYSLRRFRKEIKYDETGEDLGVFKPGSYMAATSKLGDGPHKKAVKKIKWNQKMYNQWLEDVASNGGWEHAFDMAQNAKHERGLIDWVKKNHRGEDPMQRIQWDIEAFAESVVTEGTLKISGAAYDLWDEKEVQRKLRDVKIKIIGDIGGVATIKGNDKELQKVKDILGLEGAKESVTKDHFSEWCKLNEAKSISREDMMKFIEKYMRIAGTSEEFNGSEGGIWVSGEDSDEYKGNLIYSYYSEGKAFELGVNVKWEKELNKRGWYSEWYDAGTIQIWPI